MNPLRPVDLHHLRAAEGWLELGNVAEAREELDNISTNRYMDIRIFLLN